MKRENYPTYQSAVKSFLDCDNRKFFQLMEDARLSQAEKGLLEARKYFSNSKFKEAIILLEGMQLSDCFFLNAEKNLLLATANSNLGLS